MGNSAFKKCYFNIKSTNKRRNLFYLITIVFSYIYIFSLPLSAQYEAPNSFSKENYQFETFQLPGGKLENTLQCIAQDSTGILWFGTQNGLVKYDGRAYHRYLHNPLDSNSLISSYVECIFVDTDNTLWIGAFGLGFTRFDPKTNLFQRYYMKDDIGVNTILRYREHIWLGSHNGLIRFNPESKEFKTYLANPTYIDFYSSNVFRGLYVDQQDMLWAGMGFSWVSDKTKGGLYKYQPEKDNFIEYHHDPSNNNSLSDNRVKGIFEDSKHNFWIGTMGDGLNLMDRTSGHFSSFPYQPEKPTQLSRPFIVNGGYWDNHYEQVQFIHEDWEQKLWIGSFDSGLNIYDPLSNKQIHFTDGSNGLGTRNIWNIFETKDRAIFICTGGDGGGKNYRVKIKKQLFSFYSVAPDANIDNIIEDKNRHIWLGGNLEDWQFNPIDKSLSTLPTDLKKKLLITELNSTNKHLSNLFPGLIRQFGLPIFGENANEYAQRLSKQRPDLFIRCVKKDKSGNIWVGTWGDGLFCYNSHLPYS